MVIDTSALLAILQDELERGAFVRAVGSAGDTRLSVAGFVEASIVVYTRSGAEALRRLDLFLERAHITLVPLLGRAGSRGQRRIRPIRQGAVTRPA
jgi:ribonuclease VapC